MDSPAGVIVRENRNDQIIPYPVSRLNIKQYEAARAGHEAYAVDVCVHAANRSVAET